MRLLLAILIVIIIYLLQWTMTRKLWSRGLTVSLSFADPHVETGERSVISEVVENAKFLPLPIFHVKFSTSRHFIFDDRENSTVTDAFHRNDAFSVMGNERITRKLSFRADKRGYYNISNVNILTKDFFMTRTFAKTIDSNAWIYVFPKKLKLPEERAVLSSLYGDILVKRSLSEDPYSFRGLREYQSGDTMKHVNWKASARADQLMVNLYEYAAMLKVQVLLNLEANIMLREDYMEELAISAASTIAQKLLEKGVPVGLKSNGIDVISGQPVGAMYGATRSHAATVDMALARIGKKSGIESFLNLVDEAGKTLDKNTTLIVVSPYFKEDLTTRLDNLKKRGMDVHMLVPYFDIQETTSFRPYMRGLEVKLNEA